MRQLHNDVYGAMFTILKRYDKAMIRKRRNQKEIHTTKTEVGKSKLTFRFLYQGNLS